MEGDGSPLSSLCMVRAAELFPRPEPEKEDESLRIMFTELPGEFARYLGRTDDGVLALSNYRICLKGLNGNETEISIPLGVMEYVTIKDLFLLVVSCKDTSTFKCSFQTSEQCTEWHRRISLAIGVPTSLETLFAFSYYAWASEMPQNHDNEWIGRMQRASNYDDDFRREVKRLEFDLHTTWRISSLNSDFKLCPSYPRLLLVPCCITDETLLNVASFRSSRRIPAVVWRHKTSGAVLARCSQPEVGWLGWRNPKDEQLLKAIADACSFDDGEQVRKVNTNVPSETSSTNGSHEEVSMSIVKKVLIVDARSYTSAVTNRARGGGCECPEYYPCAQIEFMSLGNIHVIRKSSHALRQLCATPTDSQNWLTSLDRTMWLTHLSSMLQSVVTICHAIEREGRPVLVHCSDGWDRTPQLVATAQLCLDPYYRTVEGFRVLVEREWLSFGHKFADRIGHGPGSDETSERCPVFLQWLDCVHQIQKQFPCSFEFSMGYLVKLAQHVFSCMFGTFLCNSYKERIENSVFDRTYSVWPFLSGSIYKNPLYVPNREQVLWPAYHLSNLSFWAEVYTSSFGNQNQTDNLTSTNASPPTAIVASTNEIGGNIETPSTNDITNSEPRSPMIKTRSYGDLQVAGSYDHNSSNNNGLIRRSSDPNMMVDAHFTLSLSSGPSNDPLPDCKPKELSNDNMIYNINDETIANFCSDTTRELNNLTEELQCSDLDITRNTSGQTSNINGERKIGDYNVLNSNKGIQIHSDGDFTDNIIESSPFYTQFNHNKPLADNHLNLPLNNDNGIQRHSTDDEHDSIDGCICDDGSLGECMLRSIDLEDSSPSNPCTSTQNFWHGNIDTSTDTLVPVIDSYSNGEPNEISLSTVNDSNPLSKSVDLTNGSATAALRYSEYKPRILPEVHYSNKTKTASVVTNHINNQTMDDSIVIQPEHQRMNITSATNVQPYSNGSDNLNIAIANSTSFGSTHTTSINRRRRNSSNSRQSPLDVTSPNGLPNRSMNGSNSPTVNSRFSTSAGPSMPPTPSGSRLPLAITAPTVPLSCPDGLAHALSEQNLRLQQIVHEAKVREEALQRELYATRLALLRKTKCFNCNNATSMPAEETEDVLNVDEMIVSDSESSSIDSLIGRRSESPDSQICGIIRASLTPVASVVDNGVENVSVCSWEAVDERNGTMSTSNPSQSNTGSVLWVPDHAATRCYSCQTEFWLGRRRHHCRSCGQIFCADCSEFWAPLPNEQFFTPVRLCGPCYHSVTTKSQIQQYNRASQQMHNNHIVSDQLWHNDGQHQQSKSDCSSEHGRHQLSVNISGNANNTSLEPCKHAVVTTGNDRSPFKVTTATN